MKLCETIMESRLMSVLLNIFELRKISISFL